MKLLKRMESRERCTESGWYAYDYLLDGKMDKEFIKGLRGFGGSFVFLEMLKKPFFKIESEHYIIKGLLDDDFFRMAVHKDELLELNRLEEWIKSEEGEYGENHADGNQ